MPAIVLHERERVFEIDQGENEREKEKERERGSVSGEDFKESYIYLGVALRLVYSFGTRESCCRGW